MDNLTKLVRDEISRQYRSVRQFAFSVDIPLSTINSALHNGVGGSSFDTVMRICKILGIKAMSDDAALYLTDDTERLLTQYAKLDDYGRHTISSVMQVAVAQAGVQWCNLGSPQPPYNGNLYIYKEAQKMLPALLSSVAAGSSSVARAGVSAAASLLILIPPALIFLLSQSSVVETMSTSGMKD